MRVRAFAILAACAAFLLAAPASAAPLLPPAGSPLDGNQEAALSAEIAKSAPTAHAGERKSFATYNLVGALIFGSEENDTSYGKDLLCKGVIIELTAPQRMALQWRACTPLKADPSYGSPVWKTNGMLAQAHTAAGEDSGPKTQPSPTPSPSPATGDEKAAPVSGSRGIPGPSAPKNSRASSEVTVGGGVDRVISPVLVELGPAEPRYARHGGSGVVLLSENPADKALNLSLCHALFKTFDTATNKDVQIGERTKDDEIQLLRPLYWPLKDVVKPALGGDKCEHRIAHYDFTRAWKIRSKLGLNGRGPYLLIMRADEARAGLIDFAGVADKDVPDLVRYFRDGFSQEDDIWSPTRHENEKAVLTAFLGRTMQITALPRLVVVSVIRAGCPLGNVMDVCTNPLPR